MVIRNFADVKVHIDTKDILKRNVIYSLSFPNGKKYIGKTTQILSKRLSEHTNRSFELKSKSYNNKKERAIRKYMTFSVEILYEGNDLNDKEIEFINKYDTFKNGYNSTKGGDGSSGANTNVGFKHSEETKKKMSESQKGRIVSEETIKKITKKTSKKIIQYDLDGNFINEFNSASEASEILNISVGNISQVCSGKRNKAGGFIWKYKNK